MRDELERRSLELTAPEPGLTRGRQARVLALAVELLDRDGWCQHTNAVPTGMGNHRFRYTIPTYPPGTARCAGQAIDEAALAVVLAEHAEAGDHFPGREVVDEVQALSRAVRTTVGRDVNPDVPEDRNARAVEFWNDSARTSFGRIRRTLIRLARRPVRGGGPA